MKNIRFKSDKEAANWTREQLRKGADPDSLMDLGMSMDHHDETGCDAVYDIARAASDAKKKR